jgi:hypothetical protein
MMVCLIHRCQAKTIVEKVERVGGEQAPSHRYGVCWEERGGLTRVLDRGMIDEVVGGITNNR